MAMTGQSGSAARAGGYELPAAPPSAASADVVSLHAFRADERPNMRTFVRTVGPYDRFFKRALDLVATIILLVILAPVVASTALTVRLTMGSKVLFFQERVGRGGRTFRMVKFRSMRHDRRGNVLVEEEVEDDWDGRDRRLTHKTTADPRHTKVGRFIRKWSLDELPQLFNVLRGDMSLVGPRPELVQVAMRYDLIDHPRHLVRPGITGLWQVSKSRGNLLHENVHIDVDYVRRVTFVGDCKILLRTFRSVVKVRGS